MKRDLIDETVKRYLAKQDLACAALIVRKNDTVVYKNKWGYQDIRSRKPLEYDSIFRMMSMTKCVTAVGVMILVEEGKLSLDDPLGKFLPIFADMKVVDDKRYVFKNNPRTLEAIMKMLFFRIDTVKTTTVDRVVTIRDLLSHASGIEQGWVGYLQTLKDKKTYESLAKKVERYALYPLDFQPGTATGYSPLAGFDILARVIEVVVGTDAGTYFHERIFRPLGMDSTTFFLDQSQSERLVRLYKKKRNRLIDMTNTKEDIEGIIRTGGKCISGSGGLYSTLGDFENFARMLANDGQFNGKTFLHKSTVDLIHTEAQINHLEVEPGSVWGLGVIIRHDPLRSGSHVTGGTYGWSGAFGTHFFISPEDRLDAVWVTNRSDSGGSSSPVSKKIEELVFKLFTDKRQEG